MRNRYLITIAGLAVLTGCDTRDPILDGVRTPIFDTENITVLDKTISDLPKDSVKINNTDCKYTQDTKNTIWDGKRKIFSGFATNNFVQTQQKPVCSGKYVYAGLTTGEVIKINPKNREIIWIADIYRASNMTGGASIVDIVAPIIPHNKAVYAGGLGDAFCKIDATSGAKKWCKNISVATPFIIAGNYAFVVSADNYLYAINTSQGDIYWRTEIKSQAAPTYESGVLRVGKLQINAADGKIIK